MMNVQLLKNGSEAYPAMLGAIERAQTCVALEMYIFNTDATGKRFRDALREAAARGVTVEVLIDAVGCWTVPGEFWSPLRKAGGRVRYFRPIRKGFLPFRDHRKLLLVDDRRAFVGGMNIGDEYVAGRGSEPPWRDNVLEIEGIQVAMLRRSFARMWALAERPLRLRRVVEAVRGPRPVVGLPGGAGVRFLESGPEISGRTVRKGYRRIIANAERGIDLAMSYFFPPGRILRGLRKAVRRGVRVRLLLPVKTDVRMTRWAAQGLYGKLLRAGIEVWEYQPSMLHAKLAVVDDVVIAGSANLDIRSSRINYELVATAAVPELAEKARRDFEEDLRNAVPVDLDAWNERPLLEKIKEKISYWFLARADLFFARSRLVRGKW